MVRDQGSWQVKVILPSLAWREVPPLSEGDQVSQGLFMSENGVEEWKIDRQIGAAAAVMRPMQGVVVVKIQQSQNLRFTIYRSVYVPTLTYSHEVWVMNKSPDTSSRN